jgi:hypothetical protein
MRAEVLASVAAPPVLEETVHVDVGEQRTGDAALRRDACRTLAASHAPRPIAVPLLDRRFQAQLISRRTCRSLMRQVTDRKRSACGIVSTFFDKSGAATSL